MLKYSYTLLKIGRGKNLTLNFEEIHTRYSKIIAMSRYNTIEGVFSAAIKRIGERPLKYVTLAKKVALLEVKETHLPLNFIQQYPAARKQYHLQSLEKEIKWLKLHLLHTKIKIVEEKCNDIKLLDLIQIKEKFRVLSVQVQQLFPEEDYRILNTLVGAMKLTLQDANSVILPSNLGGLAVSKYDFLDYYIKYKGYLRSKGFIPINLFQHKAVCEQYIFYSVAYTFICKQQVYFGNNFLEFIENSLKLILEEFN